MNRFLTALLATALFMPLAAKAQTTRYDDPRYDDYGTSSTESNRKPGTSVGVMGDVGWQRYNRDVSNEVNSGVGYGAKLDIQPQRNLGLELLYNGAVNGISSTFSTDGRLVTNQVGGNLKLNLVPPSHRALVRPFIFGGATYYHIGAENFTPGISNASIFALPAGAGIETDIGSRFIVGGRFTYNFLFNEQQSFNGRNADSWLLGLNLGARIGQL